MSERNRIESKICLMVDEETGLVVGAFFSEANAENYLRNNPGKGLAVSEAKLLDRSVMVIAMANLELATATMQEKAAVVFKRYDRVLAILDKARKNKTLVNMRREIPALDKFLTDLEGELS